MNEYAKELEKCPHCGSFGTQNPENSLKAGTVLNGRYTVGAVLSGDKIKNTISYISYDSVLGNKTVVCEYFPSGIMTREKDSGLCRLRRFSKDRFSQQREKFVSKAKIFSYFSGSEGAVKYFDTFSANNTVYYVREYAEGVNLCKYFENSENSENSVDFDCRREIFRDILMLVSCLHSSGVFHGALKPENIIINNGKAVVTDFEVCPNPDSRDVFDAPELERDSDFTALSDIYSLSALAFFIFTGELPSGDTNGIYKCGLTHEQADTIISGLTPVPQSRPSAVSEIFRVFFPFENAPETDYVHGVAEDTKKITLRRRSQIVLRTAVMLIFALTAVIFAVKPEGESFRDMFSSNSEITVPDLSGLSLEEAQSELEKIGLKIMTSDKNYSGYSLEELNTIVLQTPVNGSLCKKGDTVYVTVAPPSSQQIQQITTSQEEYFSDTTAPSPPETFPTEQYFSVPDFTGMDSGYIDTDENFRCFRYVFVYEYNDYFPEGTVFRQSPEPTDMTGDSLTYGGEITVFVSKGTAPVYEEQPVQTVTEPETIETTSVEETTAETVSTTSESVTETSSTDTTETEPLSSENTDTVETSVSTELFPEMQTESVIRNEYDSENSYVQDNISDND